MANRFLETNYFKSPFVRGLKGTLKSLYSFIICECTPSGMWVVDMEAATMYTGFQISREDFEENFVKTGKAVLLKNGRYFFPDFIEHQYPTGLQSWNKAHNKIIIELNNFGLLREEKDLKLIPEKQRENGILYFANKGASKGLQSPLIGTQGIGQGNGIGNGQGIEEEPTQLFNENLLVPEMFNAFKKSLPQYPSFVDKDFKPLFNIAKFIHEQSGLNGDFIKNQSVIVQEWVKMCDTISNDNFYKTKTLSTISNSIQEIYQITKNGKPSKQPISQPIGTTKFNVGANQLLDKLKQQVTPK